MRIKGLVFSVFIAASGISLFAQSEGDFALLQKADNSIAITGYTGDLAYVTIPEAIYGQVVNEIGGGAFSGNARLRVVSIPSSVTAVGNAAFLGDANLSSVSLGGALESIGDEAFSGCALSELRLPESLRSIGGAAFAGNNIRDILIPDSTTRIGVGAFSRNPKLSRIILGAGLKDVYFNAFGALDSVELVAVEDGALDLAGIGLDQNFVNVYANGGSGVYARRGDAWVKEGVSVASYRAAYLAEPLAGPPPELVLEAAAPAPSVPPAPPAPETPAAPAAPEAAAAEKPDEDPLGRTWTVIFAPSSAAFTGLGEGFIGANRAAVEAAVAALKKHPSYRARITGYANPLQPTAREERTQLVPLSLKRAEAVAAALNFQGVSSRRMTVRGAGSANPLAAYRNQAEWYKNRRAEITIVK
jgi:outer membrane protein OmpA-like peptidoglycan-associated protein